MNNEQLNEIYELIKKTGYIQSLNIYREMNDESTKEYSLILVISTCPFYEGDAKVKFIFKNVQEFKLGDINNFYKVLFEIQDVSYRQLEDIKYYVNEIEYNMISFGCSDIEYETF
ncbi:MAG: hypothetical protein IJA10_04330 [Lachnospiraceae bacterium]|nr:hypothetical protein [Lachnospiraceae bacterium]